MKTIRLSKNIFKSVLVILFFLVVITVNKDVLAQTDPTPTPSVSPFTNLILNNSFEDIPLSPPWSMSITQPAAGSFFRDSSQGNFYDGFYSARIEVTQAYPNPTYVQLKQSGIVLIANQEYRLTFWAKAAANRNVSIIIKKSDNSEYANQQFPLTDAWQKYSFTFTPETSDSNSVFTYNVAENTGYVWIDNISLTANYSNLETILSILLSYGSDNSSFDINTDGKVNSIDFSMAIN